jgi:hypothetical protein
MLAPGAHVALGALVELLDRVLSQLRSCCSDLSSSAPLLSVYGPTLTCSTGAFLTRSDPKVLSWTLPCNPEPCCYQLREADRALQLDMAPPAARALSCHGAASECSSAVVAASSTSANSNALPSRYFWCEVPICLRSTRSVVEMLQQW